jgi:hypothetical protein
LKQFKKISFNHLLSRDLELELDTSCMVPLTTPVMTVTNANGVYEIALEAETCVMLQQQEQQELQKQKQQQKIEEQELQKQKQQQKIEEQELQKQKQQQKVEEQQKLVVVQPNRNNLSLKRHQVFYYIFNCNI